MATTTSKQDTRTIAVLNPLGEELVRMLRCLSPQPDVQVFENLYASAAKLTEFRPEIVFLQSASVAEADIGGLRMLHATLGALTYVLVTPVTNEVEAANLARRLDGRTLLEPVATRELTALVQNPRMAVEPSNPEFFADLARGLGDAINNPLMFASGHLQLLELRHTSVEDRQQLFAIKNALQEISSNMEKIRLLGEQGVAPRTLCLLSLLEEAQNHVAQSVEIQADNDVAQAVIWGCREQLQLAFQEFLSVAKELGEGSKIRLRRHAKSLLVEAHLEGEFATPWQLPRSFEPYYLARTLRGSKHGLALFLVQAIIHAHGGTATAHKPAPHRLVLELSLMPA